LAEFSRTEKKEKLVARKNELKGRHSSFPPDMEILNFDQQPGMPLEIEGVLHILSLISSLRINIHHPLNPPFQIQMCSTWQHYANTVQWPLVMSAFGATVVGFGGMFPHSHCCYLSRSVFP
jgi:hypothetical protein